jgi:hypothetical protein
MIILHISDLVTRRPQRYFHIAQNDLCVPRFCEDRLVRSQIQNVCVRAIVCRREPISEWVPARVTKGMTSSSETPPLVEEEAPLLNTYMSNREQILVMGPDRTQKQELLSWRGPAAIYLIDRQSVLFTW